MPHAIMEACDGLCDESHRLSQFVAKARVRDVRQSDRQSPTAVSTMEITLQLPQMAFSEGHTYNRS
jgi:hypothetical protein